MATNWPDYKDLPVKAMVQKITVDGCRADVGRDQLDVYDGLTWRRDGVCVAEMNVELCDATIEIDEAVVDASPAEIRRQVREYERGDCRTFDLDVDVPDGFLGEVMAAMNDIPYGETRTYGELAAELDTAPVAVGQACGRNPVPIIVPCHRVVASDGGLRGYSASGGVDTKRRLLDLEARHSNGPVQSQLPLDG